MPSTAGRSPRTRGATLWIAPATAPFLPRRYRAALNAATASIMLRKFSGGT